MNTYPHVTEKKRTFWSTAAWGVSATAVTGILCGTGIICYGLTIVDGKADNVIRLAQSGVENLPEFIESLPPALADMVHDQRRPDYARQLDVSARLAPPRDRRRLRPVVEITNRGDEVVTLASLRIVVLDADGDPIAEANEWAATPLAADHDWRGPLMPGATRTIPVGCWRPHDAGETGDLSVRVELTDVRVWKDTTPA